MSRKPIASMLFILFCTLNALCLHAQPHSETQSKVDKAKPNIIFILTDDQRWNALNYAGNKLATTPQMNKLAENGVYFKNSVVTTPICSASRASIFTGLYERSHRYTFHTGDIRSEFMEQSYPKLLKKAGYYMGFFGKYGVKYSAKAKDFDVFEDYDRNNAYSDYRGYYYKTLGKDTVHLTRYTGEKALEFIDKRPHNKPFFLALCFSAPHAHDRAPEQYFWQKESDKLYQNMNMPAPELADDRYFKALPAVVKKGYNRERWHWRNDTPEKYQHSTKGYYRMIYGIDLEIGKIRNKLEEQGLAENTVIILLGDNGFFLGERQLSGKWLMYDNCIRTPLIIYDPRVGQHRDIEDMVLSIDVPATILDLAGVPVPTSYHGKSLVPIISGQSESIGRDTILVEHLWEFEHIPPSEAVRTSKWKYLRYINDKRIEELYNLEKDPYETQNLVNNRKYRSILIELRNKLDELGERYSCPFNEGPQNLTVETIRNTEKTQINDRQPEFSWTLPAYAEWQRAYQILVSDNRKLLDKNIGNMWNSGIVRSNRCINIEYAGKALQAHTTYFWKVRFFDRYNRVSNYSKTNMFKTGDFDTDKVSGDIFQIEKQYPVRNTTIEDQTTLYDFGKDAFGTLELNYSSQQPEILTIRLGEKLRNGRIDQNPGGTIRYQEIQLTTTPEQQTYRVELKPDPRNTSEKAVTLPDSFPVLMPFRYVEISGVRHPLRNNQVIRHAYFHYFDEHAGIFNSSDSILNQVWELCKYSMKATSFAGIYVDGDRERIPYEADAYINQLSHYAVDREYSMARKTIEYFFDSKPTWPTEWQLHVAMMMYQDYLYTGNTELIKKYYERLKTKTLMDLETEDGFISTKSPGHNAELIRKLAFQDTTLRLRDIVDWPPKAKNFGGKGPIPGEQDNYDFKAINTVVNAFYYHNMKIMANFAKLLNKPREALDFEYRAARVKKAINEKLWNEQKGCYIDGIGSEHASLHANMFLLAFDAVPETRKESVVAFIKTRGMACSVYGAQYLLEALYKAGAADYAMNLLTATHDRSWYNMIKIGSTITLEAWDMKYKSNGDWNHAWGAAPANIIVRGLWGIEPAEPGFYKVHIQPQMSTLKNSTIEVPTILGTIKANYHKHGNSTLYSIELPANMTGELQIPTSIDDLIIFNNTQLTPLVETIQLKPGKNAISIRKIKL